MNIFSYDIIGYIANNRLPLNKKKKSSLYVKFYKVKKNVGILSVELCTVDYELWCVLLLRNGKLSKENRICHVYHKSWLV